MRLKYFLAGAVSCLSVFCASAQSGYSIHPCAAIKLAHHPLTANKGTVADPLEENYDVKYVKLDIALTNADGSISGNALTTAVTKTAMSEYVFELTADLTIDSVKINGQLRTVTRSGEVSKALLPAAIATNTSFQAQVFYHGTIVSGTSFIDRGLRNVLSGAANLRYTFTLGEPYAVKDWWPCKQALQDKIDSSDVWITVDSSLKAGSNGLLKQITTISPVKRRYEWKNSYPIDYYLISASVGKYDEYSRYMHFDNSTDSMLMQHYIYPNTLNVRKPVLDSTELMVNFFSSIWGRYPFWKEKYGHCQAPLSGGEEHQTMTTLGVWDMDVVPHELAHQWFGDHVTCATWQDLWLNEGLATYAEYLHVEHFKNAAAANKMLWMHIYSMYNEFGTVTPTGAVYVDDTTDEERLFSPRLTYNKGGSIVHTLRFEANNDTLFFNTLRLYQQQFANGTATTEQFKNLVAQQYGRNMDTFFNQWIYSSGWPVYNATWNQKNDIVFVSLDQQATGNYTAHKYSTPIEIRFSGPQGDTIVRFRTNDNNTVFSFPWNKTVTGITIDPRDWLLDGPGVISKDASLAVGTVPGIPLHIYPNPVHDYLTINMPAAGEVSIFDISGKLLHTQLVAAQTTRIDVSTLANGIYFYRLAGKNGEIMEQGKLVKQ